MAASLAPQVELHVHLDGALDYTAMFEAAKKFKHELPEERICPWEDPATGEKMVVRPRQELGDCKTVEEFKKMVTSQAQVGLGPLLAVFYRYLPLVAGRIALLEELSYKFVEFQAASNVVYTEVRYSPHEFFLEEHKAEPPFGMAAKVVEAVTRGLQRGETEFGVVVRQILCCICFCPQWSQDVVETAHAAKKAGLGVVGVDLASGEFHATDLSGPLHLGHKAALDWAHEHGLPITVHAGEDGPAEHVRIAVELYHARRIGHGYHLLEDPELYARLRPKIHLECCPTSSLLTKSFDAATAEGWKAHPIARFVRDGASVSISTDDPRVFDINHASEIAVAKEKIGLTPEEVRYCTEQGLKAAFCDEVTRQEVGERISKWHETGAAETKAEALAFEIHSDTKMPPVPEVSNLVEYMMMHWSKYGDRVAMVNGNDGPETTFNQLGHKVRCCCAGLQAAGIKRGEVVALFASNCTEWVVAWMGTVLAGAVVTTINPAYGAEDCEHQLKHAKAEYVICNAASLPAVTAAVKGRPVKKIWSLDSGEGAEAFEELLKADAAAASPAKMDIRSDLLVVPYSSGTTGMPKGVMLTHYNVMYNMEQMRCSGFLTLDETDTFIAVLPFYHIYGMAVLMVYGLHVGAKVITMPKFDPLPYLEILKKQKVTTAFVAPPIVAFLAKHPAVEKFLPLPDLKDVFSAAAPLGEELALLCKERLGMKCIRQGYGMTELSPVATCATMDTTKPGSIGRLLPGITLKIVDPETGKAIDPKSGERGEMWLKGANVMRGYLDNPKATAETIDDDGFLHTGDVVIMDKEGDLFIVDRLKELIKFKGYQIAPAELEALLLGCPDLADAGVIGVPAPREGDGQVPKAFVVRKPNNAIDEEGVKDFIAKQVVDYKQLHKVEFVDAIPKNPSGKILRKELRAREGNVFA